MGLSRKQRQVVPRDCSAMDGGRHQGACSADVAKDEQVLDVPDSTANEELHTPVSPD